MAQNITSALNLTKIDKDMLDEYDIVSKDLDMPKGSWCVKYAYDYAQITGLTFGSVILVVVINMVLKMCMKRLVKFEKPMSKGVYSLSLANKLFIVQQGEEFDEVEKKFKSTMPNATISRIERVQNQAMHQAFLLQLSTLKRQLKEWDEGTMRRKLWHGTEAVEAIVNSEDGYGFLPLLAGTKVGAIWGDGTY